MKRISILTLCFLLSATIAFAQEATVSPKMRAVYDACLNLRAAIKAGSTAALRTANTALKACDTSPFASLRATDTSGPTLDGHFIFDQVFVDSLIEGRDVYRFAQRYAESRSVRGTTSAGKIYTKNAAVKAHSSVKFTFRSRDHQELAVVTEPGATDRDAAITLRVHDLTHDQWYNDTRDIKRGQPSRLLSFDLPSDPCKLELEVINCGNKDISFVVISN